jgi:ferric-dicitrate binding protein FerR (iron transport regulator)
MTDDLTNPMDAVLERTLHGDASEADLEQLATWLEASPENRRLYERTGRLLDETRALYVDATAPAPTAATIIVSSRSRARGPSYGRRAAKWAPWLVAAAALLVAGLNVRTTAPPGAWTPAEITTGPNELATVKLADGTVVRLGPSTRLFVTADRPREARLEGRAYFAVTASPDQPFLVHTRSGTAKVLGTRFQVTTADDELRLLVLEGRVALEAPENTVEVTAGQQSGVRNRTAMRPSPLTDAAL